jgi:hypothetical protein
MDYVLNKSYYHPSHRLPVILKAVFYDEDKTWVTVKDSYGRKYVHLLKELQIKRRITRRVNLVVELKPDNTLEVRFGGENPDPEQAKNLLQTSFDVSVEE